MSTTAVRDTATAGAGRDGGRELRRLGALSLFAAVYTYALVVFGGIVRITGSGMGCGDDWPRCNGQWIPTFTLETLIEYVHRLLAAGIGVVVLVVFAYALVQRGRAGFAGPGGVLRPLGLGAVLLVFQVALGAITVRLELPTGVTVLHFITALLFMATLIVAAVRAGGTGGESGEPAASGAVARSASRAAMTAAALGLVVVSFGAITANLPGAPLACQGFPLCNGSLLPQAATPIHVHWSHRLAAFVLLFHVVFAARSARRRGATRPVVRAAQTAAALVIAQVAVAAVLVLLYLPAWLQALHLAVGAAVWFVLVVWSALARRDARSATAPLLDPAMRAA
jgi:cytochrome c oxidase assembly protein subunit 15